MNVFIVCVVNFVPQSICCSDKSPELQAQQKFWQDKQTVSQTHSQTYICLYIYIYVLYIESDWTSLLFYHTAQLPQSRLHFSRMQ